MTMSSDAPMLKINLSGCPIEYPIHPFVIREKARYGGQGWIPPLLDGSRMSDEELAKLGWTIDKLICEHVARANYQQVEDYLNSMEKKYAVEVVRETRDPDYFNLPLLVLAGRFQVRWKFGLPGGIPCCTAPHDGGDDRVDNKDVKDTKDMSSQHSQPPCGRGSPQVSCGAVQHATPPEDESPDYDELRAFTPQHLTIQSPGERVKRLYMMEVLYNFDADIQEKMMFDGKECSISDLLAADGVEKCSMLGSFPVAGVMNDFNSMIYCGTSDEGEGGRGHSLSSCLSQDSLEAVQSAKAISSLVGLPVGFRAHTTETRTTSTATTPFCLSWCAASQGCLICMGTTAPSVASPTGAALGGAGEREKDENAHTIVSSSSAEIGRSLTITIPPHTEPTVKRVVECVVDRDIAAACWKWCQSDLIRYKGLDITQPPRRIQA